ncbi:TetR/AcrR family transcriptional regulator [Kitasatospora sp. NBC_00374]|uniref:TetR/AcrR family transcriptional regulator n=1 Tax=Kitasatospora sp. NBC_00374 TaxID=2975964 RepID=UPI0030E44CE1
MAAIRNARERARAELTREIKEEARRRLASEGAQRLSLRAVARELGMASSALYRYFPSRDDLLTALIIDAYRDLGDTADRALAEESSADGPGGARRRWRVLCQAVRGWALAHPHEYALIYGTPVPGYRAPAETIEHAARLPLALGAVVRDCGTLRRDPPSRPLPPGLAAQLGPVRSQFFPELPEPVLVRVVTAWIQLLGMLSFELFGHLRGSVDPADEFFGYSVEELADLLGLPADPPSPTGPSRPAGAS